jgi:hypothetical protein
MSKKKVLMMEHIWLALTLISFTIFVIETIRKPFSETYVLLILAGISGLMFYWRRTMRKREDSEK